MDENWLGTTVFLPSELIWFRCVVRDRKRLVPLRVPGTSERRNTTPVIGAGHRQVMQVWSLLAMCPSRFKTVDQTRAAEKSYFFHSFALLLLLVSSPCWFLKRSLVTKPEANTQSQKMRGALVL